MSLVNELQESCEKDDVLTVLRKAKRLSAKLGRDDICDWIDHELNGYKDDDDVIPEYRRISITFAYRTNGYVPMGYGMVGNGVQPLPDLHLDLKADMVYSVSEIEQCIKQLDQGNGLYYELDRATAEHVKSLYMRGDNKIINRFSFLAQYNQTEIRAIADNVKDKILDWACSLERSGVLGTDNSFTDKERNDAQSVNFTLQLTEKSLLDHLTSWYGIIGTTVTILGFWAFGWQTWKWWFFGL
jgi:hypothetical protein